MIEIDLPAPACRDMGKIAIICIVSNSYGPIIAEMIKKLVSQCGLTRASAPGNTNDIGVCKSRWACVLSVKSIYSISEAILKLILTRNGEGAGGGVAIRALRQIDSLVNVEDGHLLFACDAGAVVVFGGDALFAANVGDFDADGTGTGFGRCLCGVRGCGVEWAGGGCRGWWFLKR